MLLIALFAAGCGGGSASNSSPSQAPNAPAENRGEQIVAEFLKRDAAPFRKMRVRFTIRAEGEAEKIYELDNWRKQTPEGTTTLSQIVKPAEDSDLASLTIEPKGQKATVITYAQSRDEFRETDTNKMFFGGLTAGELLGEWSKYDYRLLSERDLNGRKVLDVEGTLKPATSSLIARMNVLFRADNYLPAELHLFDSLNKEIRVYKVAEFKDDAAGTFAARTEVDNPIYKTHVVIEVLDREFPEKADDSIFTREKLKQIVRK
jgi:hypothetical protein